MILLPLPGAEALTARLAVELRARIGTLQTRRFPDGELYLRLLDDVHGEHVIAVAALRDPDPQALALWYLAHTARELGADQVGLAVPYLPYMRQDMRFEPGEAVTAGLFARFLSRAFDWILTVDPHLHRLRAVSQVFAVPAVAVSSAPAIARWVQANVPRPVIVGPDSESEQWAAEVAQRVGCPAIVLVKSRHGDREVEITVPDAGRYAGRTPVLIDDIVSTAQTMAAAALHVRAAFGSAPFCVGVHAIFCPGAEEALESAGVARIATCNTLAHATNEIDIAPALATALRQLVPCAWPAATARDDHGGN